jgi:hypothetical protein
MAAPVVFGGAAPDRLVGAGTTIRLLVRVPVGALIRSL